MVRSSRSKMLVLISGLVTVGLLTFFWLGQEETALRGIPAASSQGIAAHPSDPHLKPPAGEQQSESALATLAPRVEDLREQAEGDPHGTPPALLEFADEVGREMESAFDSAENAKSAARMLEGCALPGEETPIPQSARALCAENLRRLAERYPQELRAVWERVREQLPGRVLQLLDQR